MVTAELSRSATAARAKILCSGSNKVMGVRKLKVIDVPQGSILPVRKDWHSRGDAVYIVWDSHTNTVILSSKLTSLAEILNEKYARNKYECVRVSGLYGAALSGSDGYTGGLHKMRYKISRTDLGRAHEEANKKARQMGASISAVVEVA